MFFDFFGRLRRKTAEAILGGAGDALAVLTPDETPPANLDDLRRMLAEAVKVPAAPAQLAAAPDDEPKPRRKG
jgi:hypothetical protein